jgi:hypothetical protein
MEFSRHTWQLSILLNGKSLPAVHVYSDWLVFRHKVHIRFGEIHSWILYWNNWTLSKDPKQEQARADLWLKYYGPMDRTLLEQECTEVFEEELLTEFPIDKKRVTFEYLARAIYSTQSMSVNTDKEYTSYLSNEKIWASMEEMLDEADDNDIPMDDILKKNIKIFTVQGKPKKLAFKTTITGKKIPDCCGCPYIVLISMGRDVISTHTLFML